MGDEPWIALVESVAAGNAGSQPGTLTRGAFVWHTIEPQSLRRHGAEPEHELALDGEQSARPRAIAKHAGRCAGGAREHGTPLCG